ncbi:hypothetical protein STEG23_028714, partial [Scotinomys teguina]
SLVATGAMDINSDPGCFRATDPNMVFGSSLGPDDNMDQCGSTETTELGSKKELKSMPFITYLSGLLTAQMLSDDQLISGVEIRCEEKGRCPSTCHLCRRPGKEQLSPTPVLLEINRVVPLYTLIQDNGTKEVSFPSPDTRGIKPIAKDNFEHKRIDKSSLYNKAISRGITIPDFKLYYRATVLKQLGTGIKTDMWTNGIELKTLTLTHTEEKVGSTLERIGTGDHFLNITPIAQTLSAKINRWDYMKLRSFCKARDTITKTNCQPTEWEKIFTNSTSDRGLISRIYKELKKEDIKTPDSPIEKWAIELNRELMAEEY